MKNNIRDLIQELEEDKEYLINTLGSVIDLETLINMSARLCEVNKTINLLKNIIEEDGQD